MLFFSCRNISIRVKLMRELNLQKENTTKRTAKAAYQENVSEFVEKENYTRALIKDLGALLRKNKENLECYEVLKSKLIKNSKLL